MSDKEETGKTEVKEEVTEDKEEKNDLIELNVALLAAENKRLKDIVIEKDGMIEKLTLRLGQAMDLIEDDTKSKLLAEITPKVSIPDEYLAKMPIEKLSQIKETLDVAVTPAFRSGTPFISKEKSPRAKLDSMYEDYMAKIRGRS